ncbi:MAG: NYN domain-containing protein [Anaerolineae bacterium]|nr:NYN domain-containing protein [Anaerolineae bacterium]
MINLTEHVAILIDADNTNLRYVEQMMKLSEYYGTLDICRAYGDWKSAKLSKWYKKRVPGVEYIQVDQVGKNATDHRLLVELGEIITPNHYGDDQADILVLVSSDGDFASACQLTHERGKRVIIIGERKKMSKGLRNLGNQIFYLEDLNDELEQRQNHHPIPPNQVRAFWGILQMTCINLFKTTQDDWITLSELGIKLHEFDPNYEKRFGKYQLLQWLHNFDWYLEIDGQRIRRNPKYVHYSLLVKAFWETSRRFESVSLTQFGKVLRELNSDYESQFGNRKLSAWLKEYPDTFKISEGSVTVSPYGTHIFS